jgi:hypothetical protein
MATGDPTFYFPSPVYTPVNEPVVREPPPAPTAKRSHDIRYRYNLECAVENLYNIGVDSIDIQAAIAGLLLKLDAAGRGTAVVSRHQRQE